MNVQTIEKNLEGLLKKLSLPKSITIQDIKDIIWNDTDKAGSMKLFSLLAEYTTDRVVPEEIMHVCQDAWNYFPHRSLGGKSPYEVAQDYRQTGKADASSQKLMPKKGKSLQDVFENRYPEKVVFEKISDDTWGFGFPKLYHDLTEHLWELEESQSDLNVREKELYRMIQQMPELFDAANALAHIHGKKHEFVIAKRLYEEAITKARRYIPETFKPGEDRIIWAHLENRPFLRLLSGYAQFVEQFEGVVKAIPLYEEILLFNPNDNQGIRGILATAYVKTMQSEKVIALTSHYPDDTTPELVMGNVLALFQLGQLPQAKKFLAEHKDYQKHVITELLKSAHPKPAILMENRVTMGGEDEAYYYWQSQGKCWQETKGALEFLAKETQDIQPDISDADVLAVDFFSDFLLFLKLLKERPIKRTATGNISIKNIEPLLLELKTVKPILEHAKEMGWKLRTEDDIRPLNLLNILAKLMGLTRKSRDKLLLTKNGKEFLEKLSPVDQYRQLVLYYWQKFNWAYLTGYYVRQKDLDIAEKFQTDQRWIWRILSLQEHNWVDHQAFCEVLREELNMEPYLQESFSKPEDVLDRRVHSILFSQNLCLFGCVEVKTKQGKYKGDTDIVRFRSTNLGLAMYKIR